MTVRVEVLGGVSHHRADVTLVFTPAQTGVIRMRRPDMPALAEALDQSRLVPVPIAANNAPSLEFFTLLVKANPIKVGVRVLDNFLPVMMTQPSFKKLDGAKTALDGAIPDDVRLQACFLAHPASFRVQLDQGWK